MINLTDIDPSKWELGVLCKYGHDFNGTGQSLRRIKSRDCLECRRLASHRYRHGESGQAAAKAYHKTEGYKEARKHYRLSDRGKEVKLEGRKREQAIRKERYRRDLDYREQIKEEARKRLVIKYRTNSVYRQSLLESLRLRWRTDEEYRRGRMEHSIIQTHKYRARQRSAHSLSYVPKQIANRVKDFSNCCAYCDRELANGYHIDHFLSLKSGGTDTLSNLVPACPQCNLSKGSRDPWVWYSSQPFYCPKRWQRILKVLGKKDYLQLPLL